MAKKQGNPPIDHTVENGDTLFDIAQAYYGDGNQWRKIAQAPANRKDNRDLTPESLKVGQKIRIP